MFIAFEQEINFFPLVRCMLTLYHLQDTSEEPVGTQPPFYEELNELFGHTIQDRGTLISAGGVRKATPTTESEDTPPFVSQDPIAASSVGPSSKRPVREEVVDSPPKKKSDSLEDCIRDMSETVVMRCCRALTREQEEVDLVRHILEQDGIEQGTDLYCMATHLCRNAVNSCIFTTMRTKENQHALDQFQLA
jgi:hypothetical protein